MEKIFEVCFFVGAGLAVLDFLLGHLLDLNNYFDFDMNIPNLDFVSLSPTLGITFLTVFGGVGKLFFLNAESVGRWKILFLSVLSGLAAALILDRILIRPLKRAENTSSQSQSDMIGREAVVSETILKNQFGEIRYSVCGNSYTTPAKSVKGDKIMTGVKVKICKIENNIFYVDII